MKNLLKRILGMPRTGLKPRVIVTPASKCPECGNDGLFKLKDLDGYACEDCFSSFTEDEILIKGINATP